MGAKPQLPHQISVQHPNPAGWQVGKESLLEVADGTLPDALLIGLVNFVLGHRTRRRPAFDLWIVKQLAADQVGAYQHKSRGIFAEFGVEKFDVIEHFSGSSPFCFEQIDIVDHQHASLVSGKCFHCAASCVVSGGTAGQAVEPQDL